MNFIFDCLKKRDNQVIFLFIPPGIKPDRNSKRSFIVFSKFILEKPHKACLSAPPFPEYTYAERGIELRIADHTVQGVYILLETKEVLLAVDI